MYVNNKGFTLIELLLVIAAISILAGIIVTAITGRVEERKKESNTFNEVKTRRVVVSEDKFDCSPFEIYKKAGDYLEIPGACHQEFGITDSMIDNALKAQERKMNPCNN